MWWNLYMLSHFFDYLLSNSPNYQLYLLNILYSHSFKQRNETDKSIKSCLLGYEVNGALQCRDLELITSPNAHTPQQVKKLYFYSVGWRWPSTDVPFCFWLVPLYQNSFCLRFAFTTTQGLHWLTIHHCLHTFFLYFSSDGKFECHLSFWVRF